MPSILSVRELRFVFPLYLVCSLAAAGHFPELSARMSVHHYVALKAQLVCRTPGCRRTEMDDRGWVADWMGEGSQTALQCGASSTNQQRPSPSTGALPSYGPITSR
eukprot:2964419-Rhodomonas_salina.4